MINERLDQQLVDSNIQTLKEGAELIRILPSDQYTRGYPPAFQSTIGAHFRHVLEHYRCFFLQVSQAAFCYDKRERNKRLEQDSHYALDTIEDLVGAFCGMGVLDLDLNFSLEDEQTSSSIKTTVNRELLFLQSHSVHHYAIIGAMTRAFGNQLNDDFGVAIATRVHNDICADTVNPATTVKGATCAQ